MELEADHIAILLMAEAGFDPQNAITYFDQKLELWGHCLQVSEAPKTHPRVSWLLLQRYQARTYF